MLEEENKQSLFHQMKLDADTASNNLTFDEYKKEYFCDS